MVGWEGELGASKLTRSPLFLVSNSVGISLGDATSALKKASEAYQKAKKDIGEMKELHFVRRVLCLLFSTLSSSLIFPSFFFLVAESRQGSQTPRRQVAQVPSLHRPPSQGPLHEEPLHPRVRRKAHLPPRFGNAQPSSESHLLSITFLVRRVRTQACRPDHLVSVCARRFKPTSSLRTPPSRTRRTPINSREERSPSVPSLFCCRSGTPLAAQSGV